MVTTISEHQTPLGGNNIIQSNEAPPHAMEELPEELVLPMLLSARSLSLLVSARAVCKRWRRLVDALDILDALLLAFVAGIPSSCSSLLEFSIK